MTSYYKDEILKLKYLRTRIAESLVLSGIYPDHEMLRKRLASVDEKLALFQYVDVDESTLFDTDKFNSDFMAIYQDLLIIYQLVYEFTVENYAKTKAYVEMHMTELEALAQKYESKTKFEIGSTSLGNTIFFKATGIIGETSDYSTLVDFGKINVRNGSKISFHISGNNFENEDVTFYLGNRHCKPYSVAQDYLEIPGTQSYEVYNCEYPDDIIHNSMFVLNNEAFTPSNKNRYIIYGGKDNISVGSKNIVSFVEKTSDAITLSEDKGKVSFYVINGSYINFDFSKQPLSQNFTGYTVNSLSDHQIITFEYEGPFSFNYITDGEVYAVKKTGVIKGDSLFYPDGDNLTTFRIEEYANDDYEQYNLSLLIKHRNTTAPSITMVAIKELSSSDWRDSYDKI